MSKELTKTFPKMLLQWNQNSNSRQMPWKGEKDPYKIWLSEIILQQTRVAQGLKYYENFISSFPNVQALAAASEEQVFKLWEGLGYYSRCKNLIATAKYISQELAGKFPETFESIIALKGIGHYTAAAISSFAYDLPYAVVDGNVIRVLSRITGTGIPANSNEGRKFFRSLAMELLPQKNAGSYNQAIMDFGATLCKPRPECKICFYTKHCVAYQENRQLELPVKEKTGKVRKRFFHYFFSICGRDTVIVQRTEKDIWQQLYEFPGIETENEVHAEKAKQLFLEKYKLKGAEIVYSTNSSKQKLTHQEITFQFHKVNFHKKEKFDGYVWIPLNEISSYPFPRALASFLQEEMFSNSIAGRKFD